MHGTAILDCKVIDFPDVKEHVTGPMAPGARNFLASGYRAITIMPMIRGKTAIGAISVVRVDAGAVLRTADRVGQELSPPRPSSPLRIRDCSANFGKSLGSGAAEFHC